MDNKEITDAVLSALSQFKALEFKHFETELFKRDERIKELETELNSYKQACIELDGQLTAKEDVIGDMKLEKNNLLETIDTKDIS